MDRNRRHEKGAEMMRLIEEAALETPEVDAAEQRLNAVPTWQEDEPDDTPAFTEANEWDADEQRRVVEFDDEYR
ncbi:hypothetical protein FHX34_1011543 [Actinoplanes teichomyceticus]|uniref:Uncharacterized protein n=2 Tax=Actinoplanes teichomyceticus TaxID=1867 RepID=A0A561WRS0_ACTTI|nr:hypothetical protein FHX34_1011543 [Actinoplanes teichomyceticus]